MGIYMLCAACKAANLGPIMSQVNSQNESDTCMMSKIIPLLSNLQVYANQNKVKEFWLPSYKSLNGNS